MNAIERNTTRRWWEWVVLSWCGFLILAAITAIYPGWPNIKSLLASDGAPAWVQAVGSIASIWAAIAIATHQQTQQRLDRLEAEADRLKSVFAPALAIASETAKEITDLYAMLRAPVNLDPFGFEAISKTSVEERLRKRTERVIAEVSALDPTKMPSIESILSVRQLHALAPQAADLLSKMKRGIFSADFRTDMRFHRIVGDLRSVHADLEKELHRLTRGAA